VFLRLGIRRRRCKDNIKVGITAAESGDELFKLVQPWDFVNVVCKNCVLLPSVFQQKFGLMEFINKVEFVYNASNIFQYLQP
jgi:hypothetical protein